MLQREGKWTPTSALDSACSLDCPACGGDGCGVCGGGLLGAQKQQALEVPVHARRPTAAAEASAADGVRRRDAPRGGGADAGGGPRVK